MEVKIPCEVIENSSNFGLEPKSFGAIEEHWLLNFNLYELDAKLNSWRITWPEQTGNGEYIISLVDANDVNTGTEPGDPNDIEDPDPDDFPDPGPDPDPDDFPDPTMPLSPYRYYIAFGAVASCIIAALLWFNYDKLSSNNVICSSAEQLIRAIETGEGKTQFQTQCQQELVNLSTDNFSILMNKASENSPDFAVEVCDFYNPYLEDSFLKRLQSPGNADSITAAGCYHEQEKLGVITAGNKLDDLCREIKLSALNAEGSEDKEIKIADEFLTKDYCQ